MAPLSKAVRVVMLASAGFVLAGCNDSGSDSGGSGFLPPVDIPAPNPATDSWTYEGNGTASLASAAQVAGKYAMANSRNGDIEIRSIDQARKALLNIADSGYVSGGAEICAMTLTPSGRFLYVVACADSGDDVVLAYNTNTEEWYEFDRLNLSKDSNRRFGMTYFQGQLFVGSDQGVYRYDASKNTAISGEREFERALVATNGPVTGLAVDMVDQRVYVATQNKLYRMSPDNRSVSPVSDGDNITAITMGRVYGNTDQGGLYILENDGETARVKTIPLTALRENNTIGMSLYKEMHSDLADIAATADGRILLAQPSPEVMYDKSDSRLSYEDWLDDELDNYLAAIKSLVVDGGIPGTNNLVDRPGMLVRKIEAAGNNPNKTPIADNVGWALFLLMAIDQVKNDPDIEQIVELLIERHAGLNPDRYGGERTVDGHFVRVFRDDGLPHPDNPQPQVYVSMKYLPAAFKAAEMYPHNQNLQQYKEYLRQLFKRSSDTIGAEQRITWTNDDYGPVPPTNKGTNRMSNETWIYGDIGAAQDPIATDNYGHFTYDRDSFGDDNGPEWALIGEPVIRTSHAAFVVMGATLILNHHYHGEGWVDQNKNYYGVTMAETDDMGSPYFAAFSAGNHPSCNDNSFVPKPEQCGYYNDGPSDHPSDILHFPAVLGFGQHGLTAPMVGGYMAYRDGRRQDMLNASGGDNIPMLTRWSMMYDHYEMDSVGIADFWYGGIGLVETIAPGTIDKFRNDFYRPYVKEENGELIYSNMTPRRVVGLDANGHRTPYGFQTSPYQLPTLHRDYEVIDPEGDWIELEDLVNQMDGKSMRFTNPYFDRPLEDGWRKEGNGSAVRVSGIGSVNAVQINANGETFVSQPLDVSLDLPETRYVVRALGKANSTGKGYLRVRWSEDSDLNSEILSEDISNDLEMDITELMLKTAKPAGAKYMHIEFVGEDQGRFQFENTAVMIRGADTPVENGDFENGMSGWTPSQEPAARIEHQPNIATTGEHVLRMLRGGGVTNGLTVKRDFDVSNDLIGTRYLFRFDVDASKASDIDFKVHIETLDNVGDRVVNREDLAFVDGGYVGEKTFTIRRRPEEALYKLTIEMKRSSNDSTGNAEVYIDNFRMDKQRLFDAEDCRPETSPTGCLPSRIQQ